MRNHIVHNPPGRQAVMVRIDGRNATIMVQNGFGWDSITMTQDAMNAVADWVNDQRADVTENAKLLAGLGRRPQRRPVGRCTCECATGGFCGGCGHAGCGGR